MFIVTSSSSMVVSSLAVATALASAFECGRVCERRLLGLAQVPYPKIQERFLNQTLIVTVVVVMVMEYLVLPSMWNPFSYTQPQQWNRRDDQNDVSKPPPSFSFAAMVFSSWTSLIVVGLGIILCGDRALRRERKLLLLQQKEQRQEENLIITHPETKGDNGDKGVSKHVRFETPTSAAESTTTTPVWSDHLKGCGILDEKNVGAAREAIEQRWKQLEGRDKQLEQFRSFKLQQEERLKRLRRDREERQKQLKRLQNDEEEEDDEEMLDTSPSLTKNTSTTTIQPKEEDIVLSLERVATESSELTGGGDVNSKGGNNDEQSDHLSEERDKLRRLTDELEALKIDMHDYKEESVRREQEKIADLKRKEQFLADREDILALREKGLDQHEKVLKRKATATRVPSSDAEREKSPSASLLSLSSSLPAEERQDTAVASSEELVKNLSGLVREAAEVTERTESFLCKTQSYFKEETREGVELRAKSKPEEEVEERDASSDMSSSDTSSNRVELFEEIEMAMELFEEIEMTMTSQSKSEGDDGQEEEEETNEKNNSDCFAESQPQEKMGKKKPEADQEVPVVGDIVEEENVEPTPCSSFPVEDCLKKDGQLHQQVTTEEPTQFCVKSSEMIQAQAVPEGETAAIFVGDVVETVDRHVQESTATTAEAIDATSKAVSTVMNSSDDVPIVADAEEKEGMKKDQDHTIEETEDTTLLSTTKMPNTEPKTEVPQPPPPPQAIMWTLDPAQILNVQGRLDDNHYLEGAREDDEESPQEVDLATGLMNLLTSVLQ